MSENEGKLRKLTAKDLEYQTVQFYWADAGEKEVKCTVRATKPDLAKPGNPKEATAKLIVEKPTIEPAFTAKQGKVDRVQTLKGPFWGLVPGEGMKQGMEFSAKVNVPSRKDRYGGEGEWMYLQTVVPANYRTIDGRDEQLEQNGRVVLDGDIPYPHSSLKDGKLRPYDTGEPGNAFDTPGDYLTGPPDSELISKERKNEVYKMYLMFRPDGMARMWVPLQYIEWGWTGKATWNETLRIGAVQGTPYLKAAKDTADHPTWTEKFNGKKWKKQ